MIDSHCHIQFSAYKNDYEEVINRCKEKKCSMITVGTQKNTSKKGVDLANKYDNIYATVGLHPIHIFSTQVDEEESSFLSREEEFDYDYYKELAQNHKVVGIGECGLELFHLPKELDRDKILKKQKNTFKSQIDLANELNLPITIHIRDAHLQTVKFLNQITNKPKGVIHCFTSNWTIAKQYLDLDLYLGFTGIITFPPKKTDPQPQHDLLEVIKKCPLDRMLIETDSPYLAPQSYRGKRCEPWMTEEVAKKIGEIKKKDYQEIISITEKNTKKLFNGTFAK